MKSLQRLPTSQRVQAQSIYRERKVKRLKIPDRKPTEKQQDASSKFQTSRIRSKHVKTLESRIPLVSRFCNKTRILRSWDASSRVKKHKYETSHSHQNQGHTTLRKNRVSRPVHVNPETGPSDEHEVSYVEICHSRMKILKSKSITKRIQRKIENVNINTFFGKFWEILQFFQKSAKILQNFAEFFAEFYRNDV